MHDPVSSHRIPSGLSPDIIARMIDHASIETYRAGAVVHQRGDHTPGLSIVIAGAVRIGNRGRDGKYQVTAILGPGSSFGAQTLFADLPRTHDADAAAPSKIAQLSRRAYLRLAEEDRAIERAMLVELSLRHHDVLELLDDARRLSVKAQIAKTLLMMTAHQDTEQSVVISLTQSDLADIHGLTRLSISNCLKSMEKDGLVARGYRRISVPDRPALLRFFAAQSQLAALE